MNTPRRKVLAAMSLRDWRTVSEIASRISPRLSERTVRKYCDLFVMNGLAVWQPGLKAREYVKCERATT